MSGELVTEVNNSAAAVAQRLRASAAGLRAFVREAAQNADPEPIATSLGTVSSKKLAGAYVEDLVEDFKACATDDDYLRLMQRIASDEEPRRASVSVGWRVWSREDDGTLTSPFGVDTLGVRRKGSNGLRLSAGSDAAHTPCAGCPGIPQCDTCGIYFYRQVGDALGLAAQLHKTGRTPVLAKVRTADEVWEDHVNVFDDRHLAYRAASVRIDTLWDVPLPLGELPLTPMLRKRFRLLGQGTERFVAGNPFVESKVPKERVD